MRVLALDPSIVKTGWAAYGLADGHGAWLVESGVIRPKGDTDATRLWALADAVTTLALRLAVTHAVIEQAPAFTYARSQRMGKTLNASSQLKLNLATGFLGGALAGQRLGVSLVPATAWKGRAPKWVNQAVTGKRSHDEADAIALGSWWVRVGHTLSQEASR